MPKTIILNRFLPNHIGKSNTETNFVPKILMSAGLQKEDIISYFKNKNTKLLENKQFKSLLDSVKDAVFDNITNTRRLKRKLELYQKNIIVKNSHTKHYKVGDTISIKIWCEGAYKSPLATICEAKITQKLPIIIHATKIVLLYETDGIVENKVELFVNSKEHKDFVKKTGLNNTVFSAYYRTKNASGYRATAIFFEPILQTKKQYSCLYRKLHC